MLFNVYICFCILLATACKASDEAQEWIVITDSLSTDDALEKAFGAETIVAPDATSVSSWFSATASQISSGFFLRGGSTSAATTQTRPPGQNKRPKRVRKDLKINMNGKKSRTFGVLASLSADQKQLLEHTLGVFAVVPNIEIKVPTHLTKDNVVQANEDQNDVQEKNKNEYEKAIVKSASAVQNLVVANNVSVSEDPTKSATATTQWNLDRIDQAYGMDKNFFFGAETGTNVDVYIIDTGVFAGHESFGGRVMRGVDTTTTAMDLTATTGAIDCHGHGTHVASTAAGDMYGVARGAAIIPVKFMDCSGRGNLASLGSAVDWVVANMKSRGVSRKAVINLSIEAAANDVIDSLVEVLYDAGAVVVVAAANYNSDACNYSPARVRSVLTVGGSSMDDSRLDVSNTGACVDLYAPGDAIVGASAFGATKTATKYGTSMASPLVAGVAATMYERFPKYTNLQIQQAILAQAAPMPAQIAGDLDCKGQIPNGPNKLIVQSLIGASRKPQLFVPKLELDGYATQNDFLTWIPELTPMPVANEVCVSFKARVSAIVQAGTIPELRVMLSSQELPQGVLRFFQTSTTCRNNAMTWFLFESNPTETSVMNSANNILKSNPDPALATLRSLSTVQAKPYYVSLKLGANNALVYEMGVGDGLNTKTILTTGSDPNVNAFQLVDFNRLSFSATYGAQMEFTDIVPCAANQNSDDSSAGGEPPKLLQVQEASQFDTFFTWPSGWTKAGKNPNSCLQFEFDPSIPVLVAFTSAPLGAVSFFDSWQYYGGQNGMFLEVVAAAPAMSITMRKNGKQIVGDAPLQKFVFAKSTRTAPMNPRLLMKVVQSANGVVEVFFAQQRRMGKTPKTFTWKALAFKSVFRFNEQDGLQGTRFALSSSAPASFTNVAVC